MGIDWRGRRLGSNTPASDMTRTIVSWYSERTHREMPIVRYGHWGRPLLLIPTWQANFLEAEERGLISAIAHHIEAGAVTVFCVDTVTPWSWCDNWVALPEKAARSAAYSAYLDDEVVPHIRHEMRDSQARVAIGGASFGAFFAADAVCRRPDLYWALLGLSGMYHLGSWLNGYSDDNVYFHSPAWYVPQMPEGPTLDRLRHDTHIHLLTGRGAWEEPHDTISFADILRGRGISPWLDVWGEDQPHDWPTWHRMLEIVVRERFG